MSVAMRTRVRGLAARLCSDADGWEILATERVYTAAGDVVIGQDGGLREVRGFTRTVHAYSIRGLDNSRVAS